MRRPGLLLSWFDKVFLVLAVLASALWLAWSLRVPNGLWSSVTVKERVERLRNRRNEAGPVHLPCTFEPNAERAAAESRVTLSPRAPSDWVCYSSPTPRPFRKVTPTPPPKVEPVLPPVSNFAVVSVPGETVLAWSRPAGMKDVRLAGYYVFRTTPDKPLGAFLYENKLKLELGKGAGTAEPLAGPLRSERYTDTSVLPGTEYVYVVVAVGYPARIMMKDGKPVTGEDGRPVWEDVSDQPLGSVSVPMRGRTVEEFQIILKGDINGVAANFLVFKWLRDEKRWESRTFTGVVIGSRVGGKVKVGGREMNFDTGWVLEAIDRQKMVRDGRTVTVTYALLSRVSGAQRLEKKVFMSKRRQPEELRYAFSPARE